MSDIYVILKFMSGWVSAKFIVDPLVYFHGDNLYKLPVI